MMFYNIDINTCDLGLFVLEKIRKQKLHYDLFIAHVPFWLEKSALKDTLVIISDILTPQEQSSERNLPGTI